MGVIDRIVPINKGNWVSGTIYDKLNIVRHGGCAWQSKVDNNTTEPSEVSDKWMLIVRDGVNGGVATVEWDSVQYKPFNTLKSTDFAVSNGELSVIGGGGGSATSKDYTSSFSGSAYVMGASLANLVMNDMNVGDEYKGYGISNLSGDKLMYYEARLVNASQSETFFYCEVRTIGLRPEIYTYKSYNKSRINYSDAIEVVTSNSEHRLKQDVYCGYASAGNTSVSISCSYDIFGGGTANNKPLGFDLLFNIYGVKANSVTYDSASQTVNVSFDAQAKSMIVTLVVYLQG